jgi:uncharacterized protein DUF3105
VPPKKTRTPPPPRRVQAPKVRSGSSGKPLTDDERRRKLLLYGFGASGIVGLGLVIGLIFLLGHKSGSASSNTAVASTMRAAGCSYSTNPIKAPPQGEIHLAALSDPVHDWTTNPPDGGQHFAQPAPFNFYDEAVPARIVVHNQEHGGVTVWYGPKVPAATKEKLRTFWNSSPNGLLVTPYASLGSKIVLTAWTGDPTRYQRNGYWGEGHFSSCGTFDEKAFSAFRDAFRGKGPERFPLSAMTPGG